MKYFAVLTIVLAVAPCIAGCRQRKEVIVTEVHKAKPVEHEPKKGEHAKHGDHPKHGEHAKHGDHQHIFVNPEERAKKWNDPKRDQWQHPEEIVAALGLKPGDAVADIGAGTGYMVAPLSRAVGEGGMVMAIDASAEMVDYLAKRSAELGPATIVARKVGVDDPELKSASMNAVLTLDTWHHIQGRESYAGKVYAGLKPGGRFAVVDYEVDGEEGPPKEMRLTPGQVGKELEAAGFRVEVVREAMPRHYMVVGYKE